MRRHVSAPTPPRIDFPLDLARSPFDSLHSRTTRSIGRALFRTGGIPVFTLALGGVGVPMDWLLHPLILPLPITSFFIEARPAFWTDAPLPAVGHSLYGLVARHDVLDTSGASATSEHTVNTLFTSQCT